MTKSRNINQVRAKWSPERDALLREFYPDLPALEIAKALGISKSALHRRAWLLGLAKSAEFFRSVHSGRVQPGRQHLNPNVQRSQFQPGLVPWNKGKHVVASGRAVTTQFKKGDRPMNWMPLGALRVSTYGFLERKVREGKNGGLNWEGEHRLVWKAAHGLIPKGFVVIFKGGKPITKLEELTLDKLDCISHADNMRRNSIWTKSPELAQLYQLKGAIKRQINRIQKEQQ